MTMTVSVDRRNPFFFCVISAETKTPRRDGIDDPKQKQMEWSVFLFFVVREVKEIENPHGSVPCLGREKWISRRKRDTK